MKGQTNRPIKSICLGLCLAATFAVSSGRAATIDVSIINFAFDPKVVTVEEGDTVRWTNNEGFLVSHTATSGTNCAPNGLWDSGPLAQGGSYSFQFATGGTYPYYCVPHCFGGMVGAVIVQSASNSPPTVAITSPANGATVTAGAGISIEASASDLEDTIASVEFFDGATSLGVVTNAPYDAVSSFTNVASLSPGSHTLKAVATDSRGAFTSSALVSITVAPVAPAALVEVAISGLSFNPKIVTVNAGDVVRWTNGGTFSHTTTSGANCTTNGLWDAALPAGSSFALQFNDGGTFPYNCRPHCHLGMVGAVIVQSASNSPPTVAIASPANGATVTAGAGISIEASVSDLEDTIASVEFFDGATSLGVVTNAPYNAVASFTNVAGLAPGSHTLTALATDSRGASTTSGAITINAVPPVSITSVVASDVTNKVISWTGGGGPFVLQRKAAITDPTWENVSFTAQSVATVPMSGTAGFFRVFDSALSPAIPLTVRLSGALERPTPVTTSGVGSGTLSLDGNALTFNVSYSGLSAAATGAHIHGPATVSGSAGVAINLAPYAVGSLDTQGAFSGTVTLTSAQKAMILAGQAYMNVHTANNPGGEIRGQIAPVLMQAALSSGNEQPTPIEGPANGLATLALVGNQLTVNLAYQGLSGPAIAAHIHGPASASTNAGVLVSLAPLNGGSFGTSGSLAGTVTLTDDQLAYVIDGSTYINLHTASHGGGEMRGQILPQSAGTPLSAALSTAAESSPDTNSTGSGSAVLSLEGDRLLFSISYSGLTATATAAHIHGPASSTQNGPVMIPLNSFSAGPFGTNGALSGSVVLTPAQRNLILSGQTYINVHTANNPAGEIRGQIAPVLVRASLSGAHEVPTPIDTPATGSGTLTLVGNQLGLNVSYNGLSATALAAHIHGPATAAQNAGVLVDLSPFNGGAWGAAGRLAGSLTLTTTNLGAVIDGKSYMNFHTSNHPGGEMRGQLTR